MLKPVDNNPAPETQPEPVANQSTSDGSASGASNSDSNQVGFFIFKIGFFFIDGQLSNFVK